MGLSYLLSDFFGPDKYDSPMIYSIVPPDRVSENRETLRVQGGTLSHALLLPTSLYPCRDKSIEEDKGRSANRM